jgi:hypothetical protein
MDQQPRREFFKWMAVIIATPMTLSLVSTESSAAPANLSEKDPTATALGYRQDASTWDAKKYPKRSADQVCANCKLSQGGAAGAEWIPCTLYAGKLVNAKGWCAAWAKRD